MAFQSFSSSSSFSYGFTYDVFLSFCGDDTRFHFTGNLYKVLCDMGIRVFIDDRELHRGDEITPSLIKAIEDSRIAIPVFSKNYAFSSFCLDELVNIIDCFKAKGRLVLPVFYDVDPSHVRHQTGSYGEAIAMHEARFKNNKEMYINNMNRLQKWKMALNQAANLSGYHLNHGNEYEHEFIGRIVKEVSKKINRALLHVADYVVGLESRLQQVNSLLRVGSNNGVLVVGIHGIGGIGKTTLARAIYNLIADQFECLCFLHEVRENSSKHGLEHLQEIQWIPDKEIQKILKVSFDGLEEDEKSVFLDIACCFKGYDLAEVEFILCAHYGKCIKYHIGVLVEKSLIKINEWGYVTLHHLIEDMGKEIVRKESPKHPGKRSRLWFHEDIVQVLEENTGTKEIEIVYLDFPLFEEVVEWKGDEFKKMINLKTLIIKNGHFSKGPKHLPNSLRVLEWHRYPSLSIPSNFYQKKLSICKLGESCFTTFEFHGSLKKFVNMRELNLDNCKYLTHILDVSRLPNLEKISFRHCENLMTIDSSVGLLNKLKILRADGCLKLMSFPPMELTSLQRLELSFCDSLECFPEILGEMGNITEIVLEGTSIEELSYSFQNLTGLRKLQIRGSGILKLPSNILMMPKLSYILVEGIQLFPNMNDNLSSSTSSNVDILRLPNCNLSNEFLQTSLTWFANVIHLDLSRNSFTILPEFIKECRFLITLNLNDCTCLREIRGIPPNLKRLSALHCESLSSSCRSMLLNEELHEAGSTDFCLPETSPIPEWFHHQSRGSSISFWFRNNIPFVALFVAIKPMHNECLNDGFLPLATISLTINDYKFDLRCPPDGIRLMMSLGHTYLSDMQLQEMDLESKLEKALLRNEWVHVEFLLKHQMKKTLLTENGIHLFKQKNSMEDIQFSNPYKKRKFDDDDDDDNFSLQFKSSDKFTH